jgi:selenide, water dikinase
LAQVLRHVPVATDPRILVDASSRDDAAVFQVAPDRAIVATVDFFTPIVDDPYDFGRIAATNAFSDLYAMGATPLFALNMVGWPREGLPFELLGEVIRGGADVARAAGAFVLGGHSVDDPEPKYGMAAVGEARPDKIVTNAGAKPGDVLVLTKPLGTGILTTALKRDLVSEADLAEAVSTMTTLNAGAARAMLSLGDAVHAATDVTGFGLLGHLRTLLEASKMGAELEAATVPFLVGARELAARGSVPGGTARNVESAAAAVTFAPGVDATVRLLLSDAQTSGGLLIAVLPEQADALVAALGREATPVTAVIGRVVAGRAGHIRVR